MSQARHNTGLTARCFVFPSFIAALLVLTGCGTSSSKGGNVPPIANNACDNTPFNTLLSGDLRPSVTDPDSPVLSFALANLASKGVATVDVTGTFTYMPFATTAGESDSFTYTVDDLEGGQATATVTVIIVPRIMPLGDSITEGLTTPGQPPVALRVGYRKPLYDSLVGDGFTVEFVGSESFGFDPSLDPFDEDNEGHDGFTAIDIALGPGGGDPYTGVYDALVDNPADLVLLHIGTNDVNGDPGFMDPSGVVSILDEIDQWEGDFTNPITVILAHIIDQFPFGGTVTAFNNAVVTMAQARTNDTIVIVDQENALIYPDDMATDLHPNDSGYSKMADTWLNALINALPKCQ